MKTRSSSGVGQKVDLEFNVDTLRITDLGEEESESSFNQQKSSSIVHNFKRTSVVTTETSADPNQGISAAKLKIGKGAAPMIRSMLSNLNPEKD
jgi:hypothetical protein